MALRIAAPDTTTSHPRSTVKLDGIAFGFLVPIFFVASGIRLDVPALTANGSALVQVPVHVAALLLVRAVPAVAYRSLLPARDVLAAGRLSATSLPFLVAGTAIGLEVGAISTGAAAAVVSAGLLSVVLFPALALTLARRPGSETGPRPAAPVAQR